MLRVVPGRAAKIASLVDPDGIERLTQPAAPLPPAARPGAVFVDAEMCGWDECAPAVLAGTARVNGADVTVPDHGELWTATWTCSRRGDTVVGTAAGVGQDYGITRSIAPRPDGFAFTYRVRAGATPVAMCWVAHPQFRAPTGSRVHVPEARTAVDVVTEGRPRRPWPVDGIRVDAVVGGGCGKVYAAPEEPVGSAVLTTPGLRPIRLSWDTSVARWCGVWIDRGTYSREDVVAVEPATGYADDLAEATRSGRVLRLGPGEDREWWLRLSIG